MPAMKYFLAVDAGGTKTDYLLADEDAVLARVRTGSIKRMKTDAATAAANLDRALAELSSTSGTPMSAITCTCIGTAGEQVPLVTDWLREAFAERVAGKLLLLGDVEIALDAAFPGQTGVLVLAGTGSNVAGRDASGNITTAGGWGPALAEQGSGYKIGHEALRAIFLATDEGRTTLLLPAILNFWKLESLSQLVEHANQNPAPDFSRLTELVVACADSGDAIAADVLRQEGEELGYLVRLVFRRLQKTSEDPAWLPPLAFAGSVMEKVGQVRDALIASVCQEFPNLQIRSGVVDPIMGALWRARNELGA
jgi:glucosamine kinase